MVRKHLVVFLSLLFVLSGAAGLLYEVIWIRMLIRAFGCDVYAVSAVLSVFMAGLALGAWLAGRQGRTITKPLRTYGFIEIAVGISSALATAVIGYLPDLVSTIALDSPLLVLARLGFTILVLLPPTILMGATLPVLSELVSRAELHTAGRRVGFLYAANTTGAVVGVLGSGFLLIGTLGEQGTVFIGIMLNLAAGLTALALARSADQQTDASDLPALQPATGDIPAIPISNLYWLYGIAGFAALSLQVVWFRFLALLVGSSVYGFSAMLAVYLVGIALGSAIMARQTALLKRPLRVLGLLFLAAGIMAVISNRMLDLLGTAADNPDYLYARIRSLSDITMLPIYALVTVFPVTLLSGAMFPVITRLCTTASGEIGNAVGRLYTWNTVGAVAGSLITGFLTLPLLGSVPGLLLSASLYAGAGLYIQTKARERQASAGRYRPALLGVLLFSIAVSTAFVDPYLNTISNRLSPGSKVLLHREDRSGVVTVVEEEGYTKLLINGHKVSRRSRYLRVLFGYMPYGFIPDAHRTLVIGLGAGEAFVGGMEMGMSMTIAELVPTVKQAFPLFQPEFPLLPDHPDANVILADGRNLLLHEQEPFDLVIVDVTPPIFSSGAVNVYTREFIELARQRLTEDGILLLWIPTPSFASDFWMIARSAADVFPQVMVWAQPKDFGSLIFCTRSTTSLFTLSAEIMATRLERYGLPANAAARVASHGARNRLLDDAALRTATADYPAVTDTHPYTEYPLARFMRGERFYANPTFLFESAGRAPELGKDF